MPKNVRIGSGDPGRFRDAFAFVLTEFIATTNVIHILGAHAWQGLDYPRVERDITDIHKKKKLDFFICEQNNTGIHVIESLQKIHGIPVIGITSSNRITSEQIIRKGKTMDKVEMVGWVNNKRLKNQILFPKKLTKGILTLLAQLNSFVRKTTPAGYTTFQADGTEHDDFVMALLVNLFFIRRSIMHDFGKYKRALVTRKFNPEPSDTVGSGLSGSQYLIGSSSIIPEAEVGKWKVH